MKIKGAFRWIIRRDTEASNTLLGGWLNKLDMLISVVIGIQYGLLTGLGIFFLIYLMKTMAGYLDINIIQATKYRNHYISEKAPNNVRIIKEK